MARQPTFDRDDAVLAAIEVFWRDGYHAASIASLGAAMDLQPGSIYGAFGSKEGLFREALAAYSDRIRSRVGSAKLEAREMLERWFAAHIDAALDVPPQSLGRGCMLLRSASEARHFDEQTAGQVRAAIEEIERYFRACIIKARRDHPREGGPAPTAVARLLVATLAGIDALSRLGTGRRALEDAARAALAVV